MSSLVFYFSVFLVPYTRLIWLFVGFLTHVSYRTYFQIRTTGRSHHVSFLIGCVTPRGVMSRAGGSMSSVTMETLFMDIFDRHATINRD